MLVLGPSFRIIPVLDLVAFHVAVTYPFAALSKADLVVDAVYKGGTAKNVRDDPLDPLLSVGNQGGFRFRRNPNGTGNSLVVLYSTFADPEWPDFLDVETGQFTYFGDNKKPGKALLDTPRKGNRLLHNAFEALHSQPPKREDIPPFFVFAKVGTGRDVKFRGLAVPGGPGLGQGDDLVAIWRSVHGDRFQNYRALFTVLDVAKVSRAWITDLIAGKPVTPNAPAPWLAWRKAGTHKALKAPRTQDWRSKADQLPKTKRGKAVIQAIYTHFEDDAYAFEHCAAAIAQMMDRNIIECEVTQPYRDGGMDAVGKYRIGPAAGAISVDFALEAKRYGLANAVGIKQTARLIARLRYRQFGIFVTTSYIGDQAYKELREDQHPVVVIASADIVDILRANGMSTVKQVQKWLDREFPIP